MGSKNGNSMFCFILFVLLCDVQQLYGQKGAFDFRVELGLYNPKFVPEGRFESMNDSTSASLSILDDPDLFLALDFKRQISRRLFGYSQLNIFLINPTIDINMGRTLNTNSGPVIVNETWGVSYSFVRINLFLGGTYLVSKHLETFGGIGFATNVQTKEPFIGNNPGRFLDIANSLSDIYKTVIAQYQLGGRVHWKRFSISMQYQRSLANETKPFEYRGNSFALPGKLETWMISVGYRVLGK
jgi:hypothetical protein